MRLVASYLIVLFYIIFYQVMITSNLITSVNGLIFPIILAIVLLLILALLPKRQRKIRYKYERNQNIFIILVLYSLISFLSGLIFGYQYSAYSRNIWTICQNLFLSLTTIFLQEYLRNILIANSQNNLKNDILISFLFVGMNLNSKMLIENLSTTALGFRYLSTTLFPEIVTSFVLTYLSKTCGATSTILYRGFLRVLILLLPIVPSYTWIMSSLSSILLPVITYLNLNSFELMYTRRERRFSIKETSYETNILLVSSILLVIFILKGFRYYPIAVLSNSMLGTFQRGDIAILEKINKSNLDELKQYDIIYYKKDKKWIIHRIQEIKEEDGKKFYITKGDNNEESDPWKVYPEDIHAIMRCSIPCLGYPVVWLNDQLSH